MLPRLTKSFKGFLLACVMVMAGIGAFFSQPAPRVFSGAILPQVANDEMEELARHMNILTDRQAKPAEIYQMLSKKLGTLSSADKTKVFYKYHAYLKAQLPYYDELIFYQGNHKMLYDYFFYAYQPSKIPFIKERLFRDIMADLHNSGYYLKRFNSLYHPFVDYKRLKEAFKNLSDEGLLYIEIQGLKDIVEERKVDKKGKYYYNVENLLIKCDYFINQYPLSERAYEIQSLINRELSLYIFGNKSFESFDNYTGKVHEGLLNSYVRLSKRLSSKKISFLLNQYAQLVIRNRGITTLDYLQYLYYGIQKNRVDSLVSKQDHMFLKSRLLTFSGAQQSVPQLVGYRYLEAQEKINQKLVKNFYDDVYRGSTRGYQIQRVKLESSYEMTFTSEAYLSLFQRATLRYSDGSTVQKIKCFNYDFFNRRELVFQDLFIDFDLQKKKIMDTVEKSLSNYEIGAFQRVEKLDIENTTNFVITNDGIEVTLSVMDDSGVSVSYITVELSYSEFYTKIYPEYRF